MTRMESYISNTSIRLSTWLRDVNQIWLVTTWYAGQVIDKQMSTATIVIFPVVNCSKRLQSVSLRCCHLCWYSEIHYTIWLHFDFYFAQPREKSIKFWTGIKKLTNDFWSAHCGLLNSKILILKNVWFYCFCTNRHSALRLHKSCKGKPSSNFLYEVFIVDSSGKVFCYTKILVLNNFLNQEDKIR